MKKLLTVIAALSILAVSACESPAPKTNPAALKKVTKEQITQEAADKCQTLGFEQGTKEFRDCVVKQFDKMQDKYY